MQARWAWAKQGLLLALVKRPDLRYLPFPAVAFGVFGGALEVAGRDYGPQWCVSAPLAGPRHLDGGHLVGDDLVSGRFGRVLFHGGPLPSRHAGGVDLKGEILSGAGGHGDGSGNGGREGDRPPASRGAAYLP